MARFERTADVIEKYLTETCIIMNIMIKLLYRNFNKEYLTMITGELKNKVTIQSLKNSSQNALHMV